MKLWERVIEHRLKRVTSVTQNQFGFMPRRSTMEAIFFNTTIDGEIYGAEEGLAHGLY